MWLVFQKSKDFDLTPLMENEFRVAVFYVLKTVPRKEESLIQIFKRKDSANYLIALFLETAFQLYVKKFPTVEFAFNLIGTSTKIDFAKCVDFVAVTEKPVNDGRFMVFDLDSIFPRKENRYFGIF